MRERLRCVSKLLSADSDLLTKHTDVVAEVCHCFEHTCGKREVFGRVLTRSDEGFDKPERAHHEGAFAAAHA